MTDKLPNRTIKKLVNTIAEKEGFKNFKVDVTKLFTNGANCLGDLYFVDIIEPGKDTLNLFVKISNVPESGRDTVDANKIYKREVFMYTTIANIFHELQEKHNVPQHKRFKFPKYYGSHLGICEEVIILENLSAQDFVVLDRRHPMSLEYTKAGIRNMAKFHAMSFVLEREDPELFDKLIKKNDGLQSDDFDQIAELMIQLLPINIACVDPEYKKKIEDHFEIHKKGIWKYHYVPISKYSVLVHGDVRISNMMAKYQGTTLTDLKLFDYQTVFYGCPLNDLIYFLFTGTDEQLRRLYFDQIIEHYYNSLAEHLMLMSHDIRNIYPKHIYYFELKDKMMYGLEVALLLLSRYLCDPNMTTKIEDFPDIDTAKEEIAKMTHKNKLYIKRLNGIVRDYVEWGLLK